MSDKPILLSAGGTGGHMFPAAALAAELIKRGIQVEITTDDRGARYKNAFNNLPVHILAAGTIKGKFGGLLALLRGTIHAYALLGKLKPAIVVGFGGYPSVPAMVAARLRRIPTALHEQNAVMGKANAFLAPGAKAVALSYDDTRRLPDKLKTKPAITGPLVRADIAALHDTPYPDLTPDGRITILIMGGSQGARILGTIIPSALASLPTTLRVHLNIVQQCRAEELDAARMVYMDAGIHARLEPFITDVPDQLRATHLFIGRAGGTVAEMTAAGRPAIFIPYPHHADQQQKINADAVAARGGAWVITEDTLTPTSLADLLTTILGDPATLKTAAENARAYGKPDAAMSLADLVISIIRL